MMPHLLITIGFLTCLTLATYLHPYFGELHAKTRSASVLAILMGDSRQMFANHFFYKADAYFHAGKYPSIFDQAKIATAAHMTERTHEGENEADHHHEGDGHDHEDDAVGAMMKTGPRDILERFGRHFQVSGHTHLSDGNEREILPWLRLSAEMDPHRVETYITASYWLRKRLGKPAEAEHFLRQGLHENPDSYEIMFELGCIYNESKKESRVARRLWELALEKWDKQKAAGIKADELVRIEILGQLVRLEEREGNTEGQIHRLEQLKALSPNPSALDRRIEAIRAKQGTK